MFLFSVFTGLAFVDLQGLRASLTETNSEGKQYIRKARQKTEVESLIHLHPIAEQILSLYTKEKSRGDYKIFPDTMSDWKLLSHPKAVGLACGIRSPLTWLILTESELFSSRCLSVCFFLYISWRGRQDRLESPV